MTDKERIEELRRVTHLTWRALAQRLELNTPQTFTDIRSGRHGISKALAAKLLAAFPTLRQEWVMFGEGPMTKDETADGLPLYDTNRGLAILTGEIPTKNVEFGSFFPSATTALRYDSDEMREYPKGCILALRLISDTSLLVPGNNYLVETDEFAKVKRIQRGNTAETLMLYSSSTETYPDGRLVYEPFEIRRDSIRSIFAVLGYVVPQACEVPAQQ